MTSNDQKKQIDSTPPKAALKRSADISIVWVFPLIALALALSLVYEHYANEGTMVHVIFPDANGIIENKTVVKYRGMQVGKVRTLTLLEDRRGVSAAVEMDKSTEEYLTDRLQFWLVKPKVTLNGVSGLDTLITGAYIQIGGEEPLTEGQPHSQYIALQSAPSPHIPDNLSVFKLKTQNASGINPGALIYHRKLEVGQVHDVQLDDNQQAIEITITINPKYRNLIKQKSRFWSVSGIKATASLRGISVETEGIASMLVGGIAFSSPQNSAVATEEAVFRLYENASEARDVLEVTLWLPSDANISENTKVYYKSQEVGQIESLTWSDNFSKLSATANLSMSMAPLIKKDTVFWLDAPSLSLSNFEPSKLIRGTVLRFLPGNGPEHNEFDVQASAPRERWFSSHTQFTLTNDKALGISQSSKVYYHQHPIGHVDWIRYNAEANHFEFDISIDKQFERLITPDTRFYNLSGVSFSASLKGISAEIPSIQQALNGGIGIYVPTTSANTQNTEAPLATELYSSYADAVADGKHQSALSLQLTSNEFLAPQINSPVFYKQFEIGQVSHVSLNDDASQTRIDIVISPDYQHLIRENTRFWQQGGVDIEASLQGLKVKTAPLLALLAGGIEISSPDKASPVVDNKQTFALFASQDDADHSVKQLTYVTVAISQDTNLSVGSAVKYHGYDVGKVTDIKLAKDLVGILATVSFSQEHAMHFTKADSAFWLVQPSFGLAGIKHPGTLISGDYLAVSAGQGQQQTYFTAKRVYQEPKHNPGHLAVQLTTRELGSLKTHSPVLFRQLRVGEIAHYQLDPSGEQIIVTLHIYPEYKHLVKQDSVFWNASGLTFKAGIFSGIEVESESVETLLIGGVAFATSSNTSLATENQRFSLYAEPDSDWLNWTLEDDD